MRYMILVAALLMAPFFVAAEDQPVISATVITTDPANCSNPKRFTLNQDFYALDNMIIRYILEMATSVSSEVQVIMPPDRARIDSYIAAIDSLRAWMVNSSPSDYPATYKLYYCLSTMPMDHYIPSAPIRDLVNQLMVMEGEMVLSQSSRLSSGILPQDDTRLTSYLARMRDYLVSYHDSAAPNDHPRTTELTRLIEGTTPR